MAVALLLIGCTQEEGSGSPDNSSTTMEAITSIAPPPTTTPATTATSVTATAAPLPTTAPDTTNTSLLPVATTTTSTTEASATTTLAPVTDLATGLFCRDLNAVGYDYVDAVTYWIREGSPDRMDADRNGIPCETVYSEAAVVAFWGSPLPTTTRPPSLTLAGLEVYAGEQWEQAGGYPVNWSCRQELGNGLGAGTAWVCVPDVTGDGEYPVLTALILNNRGTVAVAQSGTWNPDLLPGIVSGYMGSGKFCRDVLNPDIGLSQWLTDPALRHFGAVLYWFEEGRPDRMDADRNGIPCETLVDAGIVADFWNGGFVGDTW